MINCDGQATYKGGYITAKNLDDIKSRLKEISKPSPVRSLRVHAQYWWDSSTKEFIEAIAYLKQPEWKLMLSLPNNGFDGKTVLTFERAREILDYFNQFGVVFDIYQINEPFTNEYGDAGNGKSVLLPAQKDEDAVSTYNAYKQVVGDKLLYACVPSVSACENLYPKYWELKAPRDIHLAKQKEYPEHPSSLWETWELPKWYNCVNIHPENMICSECGTWDRIGRETGDVNWESDEMIANAQTALSFACELQNEFCWHNLWSGHVSNYGNSYSLFSKKTKTSDLHIHKIIRGENLKLSFEIPDKYTAELSDAVCKIYSYDEKSGVTKQQFFKNVTFSFWRELLIRYRADTARDSTAKTAITETADLAEPK